MLNFWQTLIYRFAWLNVRFWATILFKMKVEGADRLPKGESILIASNHVSHLDPPLIGVATWRVVFHMAKKELFKVPLLLWFMSSIKTIMVDRGQAKQAVIDAIDYLNRKQAVVIFPEGTRSKSGRLGKGRSGAIVLAATTNCWIVPTVISGSEKAMTKGSKLIKSVPVTIRFGEPYKLGYAGDVEDIPHDFLRLETYRLMEKLEALLPDGMRALPEDKEKWYRQARELEAGTSSENGG